MAPLLRPGDRLVLTGGPVHVGDVVVVAAPERLLVHRVVALVHGDDGTGYVITRGDSLRCCDAPAPLATVLGRVVAVERNGRCRPLPIRSRAPHWWLRMVAWGQRRELWR